MDCDWVDLLLMDHLDGACVDPLREKIEGHLARCARCRAERDALASVEARLAGAAMPEPPAGITDAVMRSVLRPTVRPSRRRDLFSLAAAAAVLGAAIGAFGLLQERVLSSVPEALAVGELTEAVSRTGETVTDAVLGFARERLGLGGGGPESPSPANRP